jgi:hypothetical protein
MSNIKDLVRQLMNEGTEERGIVCKATKVNGMNCECEPINGNAPLLDVRLVADDSANKFVLIPKVDSIVIVEFLNEAAGYVSMVSEVSEVRYKIGDTWFSANVDGFEIKKGADSVKEIIQLIIESQQNIMVLYGNNPDFVKLGQALTKLNNVFR